LPECETGPGARPTRGRSRRAPARPRLRQTGTRPCPPGAFGRAVPRPPSGRPVATTGRARSPPPWAATPPGTEAPAPAAAWRRGARSGARTLPHTGDPGPRASIPATAPATLAAPPKARPEARSPTRLKGSSALLLPAYVHRP